MSDIKAIDKVLEIDNQTHKPNREIISKTRKEYEDKGDVKELADWWSEVWEQINKQQPQYPMEFIRENLEKVLPDLPLQNELSRQTKNLLTDGVIHDEERGRYLAMADMMMDGFIEWLLRQDPCRLVIVQSHPVISWLDKKLNGVFDERFTEKSSAEGKPRKEWIKALKKGPDEKRLDDWLDPGIDERRLQWFQDNCEGWGDLSKKEKEDEIWDSLPQNLRPSFAEIRRLSLLKNLNAEAFCDALDRVPCPYPIFSVVPFLGLENDGRLLLKMLDEASDIYESGEYTGSFSAIIAVKKVFERGKIFLRTLENRSRMDQERRDQSSEHEYVKKSDPKMVTKWFERASDHIVDRNDGKFLGLRFAEWVGSHYDSSQSDQSGRLGIDPVNKLHGILINNFLENGVESFDAINFLSDKTEEEIGFSLSEDDESRGDLEISPSAFVIGVDLQKRIEEKGETGKLGSKDFLDLLKYSLRQDTSFMNKLLMSIDDCPSVWHSRRAGVVLALQTDSIKGFRQIWKKLAANRDVVGFLDEASLDPLKGSTFLLHAAIQCADILLEKDKKTDALKLWRETYDASMQLWLSAPTWADTRATRPMQYMFAYGWKLFEDEMWQEIPEMFNQLKNCPREILRINLLLYANDAPINKLIEVTPLSAKCLHRELTIILEKESRKTTNQRQVEQSTTHQFAKDYLDYNQSDGTSDS